MSRLACLIAQREGLPAWDVHLASARGPLQAHRALLSCVLFRETLFLRRGPPSSDEVGIDDGARTTLWVFGRRVCGQVSPPVPQPGLTLHDVRSVALGAEHVLVVTRTGLALAWGGNSCGQLGTGDEKPRGWPTSLHLLGAVRGASAACGPRCSAVITLDERLWTWGEHQPASAPALLHTSWVNRHGATDCGLHAAQVAFGGTYAACDATAADACCET